MIDNIRYVVSKSCSTLSLSGKDTRLRPLSYVRHPLRVVLPPFVLH